MEPRNKTEPTDGTQVEPKSLRDVGLHVAIHDKERAMAKAARKAAWQRPGSPIGRTGARKANPKYKRNMREPWSGDDVRMLKQLAKTNTPTGVISLKMGRTETAVRGKAQREGISLRPVNRSPYNRRAKSGAGRPKQR
jgi:hypothetical protein